MPSLAASLHSTFEALPSDQKQEFMERLLASKESSGFVWGAIQRRIAAQFVEPDPKKANTEAPSPNSQGPKALMRNINYDAVGSLTGTVRNHKITVTQLPGRRFEQIVDGVKKQKLTMSFVEKDLGLTIQKKWNGAGSETHGRTVLRHFVDRLNNGDITVTFEPLA